MENDQRQNEATNKRSALTSRSELKEIPRIILFEQNEMSVAKPELETATASISDKGLNKQEICKTSQIIHMNPIRSSSDVGLPSSRMSNLTQAGAGDISANESYLEVFCSPRTFRRSVDLDVSSKERSQYEWIEASESPSNCLKVLTSSSRVSSSQSLNSECTARSIGLLSNDTDSENDLSLSEAEKLNSKPTQLRRYMSYPEEASSPELCSIQSQSLVNLKTSDCKADVNEASVLELSLSLEEHASGPTTQAEKVHVKPAEGYSQASNRPSHMLSYKCETNDSSKDIRIRQWLQDMDIHSQCQ